MENRKIVLTGTNVDSHGWRMALSALEQGVKAINSLRKPRIGIEHDMTLPPMGRINNAEIVQGEDGHHYLIAEQEFFDSTAYTTLEDGTVLIKECFKSGGSPFAESEAKKIEKIELSFDPVNFNNMKELESIVDEIKRETEVDFDKHLLLRKSHIPDPELVIKLTGILATSLGIIATKIPEKIGEAIGDDVVKFYKLLKVSVTSMFRNCIPKLRPITFIVEIPDDVLIEFIIVSTNPDEVVTAFDNAKLKTAQLKIETAKKMFFPEKIQLLYGENKEWEINYMLTITGDVIGTEKSFKRRNLAYQELLNKFIERESNSKLEE